MDRSILQTIFERYNTGLLPRGFDTSSTFHAHVPHRLSPEHGRCVPPAEFNGAVAAVVEGRSSVDDYSPQKVVGMLQQCAQDGRWQAALSLVGGRVEQRGGEASAQDVGFTITALLNGKKRALAMQYLSLNADVVLDPSVYARLLDANQYHERATDDVLYIAASHYLPFDYHLFRTAIRVTSQQNWMRGLEYYNKHARCLASYVISHQAKDTLADEGDTDATAIRLNDFVGDACVPLMRSLFPPTLSSSSSEKASLPLLENDAAAAVRLTSTLVNTKHIEGLRCLKNISENMPSELPSALIAALGGTALATSISTDDAACELFYRAAKSSTTSISSSTSNAPGEVGDACPGAVDAGHLLKLNETTRFDTIPQWALATKIWQNHRSVATVKALVTTILTVTPSQWPVADKALAAPLAENIAQQGGRQFLSESAVAGIAADLTRTHIRTSISARYLAVSMLRRAIQRRQFAPSGLLAAYIGQAGDWNTALEHFGDCLAARGTPSPNRDELSFCVQAAAWSGRGAQSMFWLERGHGSSIRFAPEVYDAAFESQDLTHGLTRARAHRAAESVELLSGVIGQRGKTALVRHGLLNKQLSAS